MYINFNYLRSVKLIPQDVIVLQTIKQQRLENLEEVLSSLIDDVRFEVFETQGLIHSIKGKKADSEISKLRLTKKGNDVMDNVSTPELLAGDADMFEYLSEMYLAHEDKDRVIGNKKKVKMYVSIFRHNMGISLHQMYWVCWLFLQQHAYTKKLENIFLDSNKNRYGDFKNNIDDSPIYQWYDDNKEKVEKFWEGKGV